MVDSALDLGGAHPTASGDELASDILRYSRGTVEG